MILKYELAKYNYFNILFVDNYGHYDKITIKF